jgi:hypothetical protein
MVKMRSRRTTCRFVTNTVASASSSFLLLLLLFFFGVGFLTRSSTKHEYANAI